MAAPTVRPRTDWTAADLLGRFGAIALRRIRHDPPPGRATEQDVIDIYARERRLYELVDGVLVEKIMGYPESCLALWLAHSLQSFLDEHDLGILAGEAGMMRLAPGLVRIPDLSFVSWDRLPRREFPREPLPDLVPDLAVEVLSEGNTPKEMKQKARDYFRTGVRLVWFVDPAKRTVKVFTTPSQSTLLRENQTLDGGEVLPGFTLPLSRLFAKLGQK